MQTRACDTKSSFSRLPKWRAASYLCLVFSERLLLALLSNQTSAAAVCRLERRLSIEKFPQVFSNRAGWSGGNIPWFHGHWSQPHFPALHYAGGWCADDFLLFKNLKRNFRQLEFQYCARNFSSAGPGRTQLAWQWWTCVVKWSELKCPHNRRACHRKPSTSLLSQTIRHGSKLIQPRP